MESARRDRLRKVASKTGHLLGFRPILHIPTVSGGCNNLGKELYQQIPVVVETIGLWLTRHVCRYFSCQW